MQRPALTRLVEDIRAGKVNTVVVYKVDRLTRSLADFAKIIEQFDAMQVSFVSVTGLDIRHISAYEEFELSEAESPSESALELFQSQRIIDSKGSAKFKSRESKGNIRQLKQAKNSLRHPYAKKIEEFGRKYQYD